MSEVIDLKTRRPYWTVQREQKSAKRKARRLRKSEQDQARSEHQAAMLTCLTGLMRLAEEGKLEGLILLAREPKSKLFLTDIVLDERVIPPNDLHSFIGCMTTLQMELADAAAQSAPALLLDGSIVDPEQTEDFEDYE